MIIGMTSKMFYNMQMVFEIGMFGHDENIAAKTNLILAAAGLIAAVVAGPIIGYLIDKMQSYKKPIAIFLLIFVFSTLFIFPFLTKPFIKSDTTIFWLTLGIVSPILGISYGYRTPIDPYSTVYSEHHKLPLTFTRGIYAIGFGITGFGISYLIQ
jgi:MFS family permease